MWSACQLSCCNNALPLYLGRGLAEVSAMFPPLMKLRVSCSGCCPCAQEHSRRANKAIAVPLLQCWLDKSLSAGLLPLERWSRASPLVNDLTHFFPLQSFHKPLLLGCRCYSPSPFPPSPFLTLPPPCFPPSLLPFIHFCTHIASRWRKRCLYRKIFFPFLSSLPPCRTSMGLINSIWIES